MTHAGPTADNYVSPHDMPNAFEREVLDILGEEAVEVALAASTGWDRDDAAVWRELAEELGDLEAAACLATRIGVDDRTQQDSPYSPGKDAREALHALAQASLRLAQRCSKACRFGLQEIQPEQRLDNAARIAIELGAVAETAAVLVAERKVDASRIAESRTRKMAKLAQFLQHDETGKRRGVRSRD